MFTHVEESEREKERGREGGREGAMQRKKYFPNILCQNHFFFAGISALKTAVKPLLLKKPSPCLKILTNCRRSLVT